MSASKGSEPAFPNLPVSGMGGYNPSMGLTKREHFAGLAMQGMLASFENWSSAEIYGELETIHMAKNAIALADALLAELSKE